MSAAEDIAAVRDALGRLLQKESGTAFAALYRLADRLAAAEAERDEARIESLGLALEIQDVDARADAAEKERDEARRNEDLMRAGYEVTLRDIKTAEAREAALRELLAGKDELLVAHRTGSHRKADKALARIEAARAALAASPEGE